MPRNRPPPTRFIGLDVHKHYLVAIGVDIELNQVLGPQRVQLSHLEKWIRKTLTHQDAVALEMTTNAFQLHDDLLPHVHSVTLVHPPHVKLITRAQVITDKIAAHLGAAHGGHAQHRRAVRRAHRGNRSAQISQSARK